MNLFSLNSFSLPQLVSLNSVYWFKVSHFSQLQLELQVSQFVQIIKGANLCRSYLFCLMKKESVLRIINKQILDIPQKQT